MYYTPLGEYRKCSICGERDFSSRHKCSPRFEARYEHDEDSDFAAVYAVDAGAAAGAADAGPDDSQDDDSGDGDQADADDGSDRT